ncbi:acetyl-CoA synthetase-like protein [Massarina eburnea CBS 473.64]|uniref:Acetyl-CoA synthetase-like protein n=1 Tax=Massarina eburnea CBS 473.64 TaxID=1395130 RepID=A0A6A6RQ94_9PLEO|nr:acetyl-CoA synthetase-like protein [Massarina eburnea CBS 473.64]
MIAHVSTFEILKSLNHRSSTSNPRKMGDHQEKHFVRPPFSPLPPTNDESVGRYSINSLLELISYIRARGESEMHSSSESSRSIGFKQLDDAISSCYSEGSGPLAKRPVALYLESDVSLFIYIAAMLALSTPVVLLSARLSDMAVNHLLSESGATTLLLSPRTRRSLTKKTVKLSPRKRRRMIVDETDRNVLILHSSGTTGLPKPLRLAHRHLLGYAACHSFDEVEETTWRNLSTLPLYHGFGLLAPCLSLSTGMSCCFPPSNTIPAAESSLRLLDLFKGQSLMTFHLAMTSLATLRFVAVGGGPIKQQVGEVLSSNNVKLLNHYGATEIGAIASIFSPGEDYDWRYLSLRKDLGLELRPLEEECGAVGLHKLVGYPCGWNEPFEIQDELELRPQSDHVEVRILRWRDDLIVLKTGEKVAPGLLEEALCRDAAVKTAVCIGNGFFELALLVEQSRSATVLSSNEFVDHVWNIIGNVNPLLDHHARISSKAAIIVKPTGKEIRRSDKGSVMRKEVQEDFKQEIQQAYEALETSTTTSLSLEPRNLEEDLIGWIKQVLGNSVAACATLGRDDDLFEMGLDSLGTVLLARAINGAVRRASSASISPPPPHIKPDFVYRNPSPKLLADALRPILTGQEEAPIEDQGREVQMRSMLSNFLDNPVSGVCSQESEGGATVLLTGSTGSLGVHVLQHLVISDLVNRVICLSRPEEASIAAEISLPVWAWDKIELLDANMQASDLGIGKENNSRLVRSVSHIRSLKSFEPHVQGTKALADLAIAAHEASGGRVRPRVLFASSIAVLARYQQTKDFLLRWGTEKRNGFASRYWMPNGDITKASLIRWL